jgi:NADH-quinone oxidoreductase subunit B
MSESPNTESPIIASGTGVDTGTGATVEQLAGPTPFPGTVHTAPGGNFLVSAMDEVINWARSNSLWPLTFGTSCCAIEMMSAYSAKYDWSRFGFEVARATPRQADVIIIAGTIVNKMAPVLKRLYDQMADPKYVVAMGACATSGGPFFYNTYSVVKGADHVIPVDVYIAGCPPRPEALIHALMTLQVKIKAGMTREQIRNEMQGAEGTTKG